MVHRCDAVFNKLVAQPLTSDLCTESDEWQIADEENWTKTREEAKWRN